MPVAARPPPADQQSKSGRWSLPSGCRLLSRWSRNAAARDPVLTGVLLISFATATWMLSGLGDVPTRIRLFWIMQLPLDAATVLFSWRIVKMPIAIAPAAVRRFWGALAVAAALFGIGDFSQAVSAFLDPGLSAMVPGPVQSACGLIGAALLVGVLLTHPVKEAGRERLRMWLDAGTIMVGAASLAWCFSVRTGSLQAGGLIGPLFGSGFVLGGVFAITKLIFSRTRPFTAGAGALGAIAAGFFGVSTVLPPEEERLLAVRLAALAFAMMLLSIAPRLQQHQLLAASGRTPGHRPDGHPIRHFTLLPYMALAITHALLAAILLFDDRPPRLLWLGALIGVVLSTGLVVARQLVAFVDNAHLLTRLDESILESRRHEERFRSLLEKSSDVTLVLRDRVVGYASPALERVLGIRPEQFIGTRPESRVHPDDLGELRELEDPAKLRPGALITCQLRARHADGSWRWLELVFTNLVGEPSVNGVVCNGRDVTDTRRLHDQLLYQAQHDPLTGLANRALFDDRMAETMAYESGQAGEAGQAGQAGQVGQEAFAEGAFADPAAERIALLIIDLDGFKGVNDTYGHHAGDALLLAVAGRLAGCVRTDDVVARIGGDEFAVLVPRVTQAEIARLLDRIKDAFLDPVTVHGVELSIRASIGMATGDARDAERLLRDADSAMYTAKRRGNGGGHAGNGDDNGHGHGDDDGYGEPVRTSPAGWAH